MTDFLIYQGKTAVILAVFYMFYRLLLSKDTFHRFNRIVLLGTAALSFVLPLCVITVRKVVTLPSIAHATTAVEGMALETMAYVPESATPWWPAALTVVFALGALVILSIAVVSIIKVHGIIRKGEHQTLESGETLVITDSDTAPFSWMKYIVLSREDYESGYSQILTHEKAHIALRHSWDILFTDLITALQWFNPAIWMLKADLRAIHEFEADDAVLRSGANVKEYQYLLIRKAVSKSGYSIANSFNHSTLKARITMMSNKKSSRMSAWKALYVIPLVGISLAATAETKVDYLYEDQQVIDANDTQDVKDNEKKKLSAFSDKNVHEGRILVDEESGSMTLIYYNTDLKECQVMISGLDFNDNVYIVNGALVNEEIFDNAMEKDDVVMINSYLKNGNKIRAAIYPSNVYVTGTVNIMAEQTPVIQVRGRKKDQVYDVRQNDILYIINGEKMPNGFDLSGIDPNTIESMEVLKTEDALKEYGAEGKDGVIKITLKEE